jgi:outer membrane protein
VLDAQQALLVSQVNLVSTQTDQVVAEYRLLASAGALTAQNLALNVDYYDPSQHYNKVRNKFMGTGPGVE